MSVPSQNRRDAMTVQPKTPISDAKLRQVIIGEIVPINGPIMLVDYDPAWPKLFAREENRIREALGPMAVRVEHVGSTSMPGLAAKPIVDIVLVVPDAADEPQYLPALERAGYVLRAREPDWFEHRMCKGPDTNVNLHIFSVGASEVDRMLRFRDRLRANDDERQFYERTKRELGAQSWRHVQHYADAKTTVIQQIIDRAEANQPEA